MFPLILIFFNLIYAGVVQANVDPCATLGDLLKQNQAPSPMQIRACYDSFPFQIKIAKQTIDTLQELLPMYVFLKYYPQIWSKWPFTPNAETSQPYKGDFQFQELLSEALVPVYDGHLEYRPLCYRTFEFKQPLYVAAVVDSATATRLVIAGIDDDAPSNIKQYLGWEITKINHKPAVDAIKEYGTTNYGKFRLARTRLTRATATTFFDSTSKSFMLDRGFFFKRTRVPKTNAVTYTMRDPISLKYATVSILWRARFLPQPLDKYTFDNRQQYWDRFCEPKKSGKGELRKQEQPANSVDQMQGESLGQIFSAVNSAPNEATDVKSTKQPSSGYQTLHVGPGYAFFLFSSIKDKQPITIGVLVVATFNVPSSQDAKWHQGLRIGIQKLLDADATKLILDLTNNGGGRICLAQALIRLFVPGSDLNSKEAKKIQTTNQRFFRKRTRNYGRAYKKFMDSMKEEGLKNSIAYVTGINKNALLLKLARAASQPKYKGKLLPFLPNRYLNPVTLKPYADDVTWPDLEITVGGRKDVVATHYGPLLDDCPVSKHETPIDHPFQGTNLMVMSNGACGSSCAIVCAFLQEQTDKALQVPSVYLASEYSTANYNATLFSYAGGQVLQASDVFRFAEDADMQPALKPFPTRAEFSFTFRSIYSRKRAKYPLEFIALRSKHMVPFTVSNALRPDRQWQSAALAVRWTDPTEKDKICELVRSQTARQARRKANPVADPKMQKRLMASFTRKIYSLGNRSLSQAKNYCDRGKRLALARMNKAYMEQKEEAKAMNANNQVDEFV